MTPIQKRFAREYAVDLNGTQAAIRAGSRAKQASSAAAEWKAIPAVAAQIAIEIEKRNRKVEAKAEDVLRGLVHTVRADPRKLVELRRTCCRYCWGWEYEFQRTSKEIERARAEHARAEALATAKDPKRVPVPFNEGGGDGWDPHRDPNEHCPECHGEGELHERFADTRDLDEESAALYRGVKRSKDGRLEMILADQDKAREMLGRHLGLFKDKLELSGKLSWEQALAALEKPAQPEGDGL